MRSSNNKGFLSTGTIILIIICLFFLDLILTVNACSAHNGKTLYVGGKNPGNYSSIQEAVNNSNDDDTIYVYNGTYYENINIDKTINLIGENKNRVIISGNNSLYAILIKSSRINISGFTIKNSKVGLYIMNSDYSFNNISGNVFSGNWEGIRFVNSSNNILSNNVIYNQSKFGIVCYESNDNLVKDNQFQENVKGIFFGRWSNGNAIINNNISESDIGIFLDFANSNIIKNNTIFQSNYYGIYLYYSKNNNISHNIIEGNKNSGFYLSNSDENDFYLNEFFSNYYDIKKERTPPDVKLPTFKIIFLIFSVFLILLLIKYFSKK
jgi:parallel beta-helix repeat protein